MPTPVGPGTFCPPFYRSPTVRICYPWHPLHGQTLHTRRLQRQAPGEYLFCELPDGTVGAIPTWMIDRSECDRCSEGPPVVPVTILASLGRFLAQCRRSSLHAAATFSGQETADEKTETVGPTAKSAGARGPIKRRRGASSSSPGGASSSR